MNEYPPARFKVPSGTPFVRWDLGFCAEKGMIAAEATGLLKLNN